MLRVLQFITLTTAFGCASTAFAGDPSTWIPLSTSIQNATQAVSGSTPIKAELYFTTPQFFEVKTFAGNTLFEVKVNANSGNIMDVDDSDGGGAQDKIAEAQFVMSQSIFTLQQAIVHAQSLYPDFFMTMIEMENRDGVAIFDVRMTRGAYRLNLRISAATGAVLRRQMTLLGVNSPLYDLYIPGDISVPDVGAVVPVEQMITAAEQQFAARAFEIELDQWTTTTYRYEMRLYKNSTVIKAKFNATTGAFLSSNLLTDPSYITKVQNSINAAPVTLQQAVTKARTVVPTAPVGEANLRLQNTGRAYGVEFLTNAGELEVKVNSTTGLITSIQFED